MRSIRTQERTFASPTHPGGTSLPASPCPLTTALEVLGGRWNLIVLYWLAGSTRRFSDLQRLMPDVTHKMLTSTLRQLESAGLVDRHVYPQVPPRVEYSLSDHGRSAQPVIDAVCLWGNQHLQHTAASAGQRPAVAGRAAAAPP
jgi:DNA-binding HxlR family transcriptional regulator